MEFFEGIIRNTSEIELNILVFVFSFLEYLIPIVPGDLALAFGIFMAVYGGYSPALIFTTSIIGGTIGATLSLLIGRYIYQKYNSKKLGNLFKKIITNSEEKINDAINLIKKYGIAIIIANRFIPVLRGPIILAAGYSGVNFLMALFSAFLSALLFNIIITIVSITVGKNFELIKSFLSLYFEGFIILVIVLFISYKILTGFVRRKI